MLVGHHIDAALGWLGWLHPGWLSRPRESVDGGADRGSVTPAGSWDCSPSALVPARCDLCALVATRSSGGGREGGTVGRRGHDVAYRGNARITVVQDAAQRARVPGGPRPGLTLRWPVRADQHGHETWVVTVT